MFICEKCATKRKVDSFYFVIAPRSRGTCELCNEYAACYDIHHSKIPDMPGGQNEPQVRLQPPDDVMKELTNKTIQTLYGKIEVLVMDTLKENEIQIVDIEDLMRTTKFCEYEDGTKILEHNGKPLLELYPVKYEEVNGNLIVSQKYRRLST